VKLATNDERIFDFRSICAQKHLDLRRLVETATTIMGRKENYHLESLFEKSVLRETLKVS